MVGRPGIPRSNPVKITGPAGGPRCSMSSSTAAASSIAGSASGSGVGSAGLAPRGV